MAKQTARYQVMNGLAGCYMPDSSAAYEFTSRRDLAQFIRAEIEALEWPASMFHEVHIRRLWGFISRHGSSTAHFSLERNGYTLEFSGLTEEEYNEAQAQEEQF